MIFLWLLIFKGCLKYKSLKGPFAYSKTYLDRSTKAMPSCYIKNY